MRSPLIVALASLALGACQPAGEKASEVPDRAVAIDSGSLAMAKDAANALGGDLVQMLTGELERGGPAAAIAVCADSAQVRSNRHGTPGVAIRRVGTRVRNPLNAPDAADQVALDAFAAAIAGNRPLPDTAFVVTTAQGTRELRYLRAIRVQEMCLACHGNPDSIAPAVRSVLVSRYPEDQATGYSVGQLRGAISVRINYP